MRFIIRIGCISSSLLLIVQSPLRQTRLYWIRPPYTTSWSNKYLSILHELWLEWHYLCKMVDAFWYGFDCIVQSYVKIIKLLTEISCREQNDSELYCFLKNTLLKNDFVKITWISTQLKSIKLNTCLSILLSLASRDF